MDREIHGQMRQALVHMNKSGITSVLDRATGELLQVFSVPEVQTWISGITEDGKLVGRVEPRLGKTTTVCPTAAGAKSWNSMAYSPRTGFTCPSMSCARTFGRITRRPRRDRII